ncbi:MAG: cupin domain-containing protein [Phycisphaeraceae bacterium]|nr:cupin domain-containing protein [Phycisphaeraceae bacterium]
MFDGKKAEYANLLQAAPIVPGAVVSKPLINSDACKVIVFAMDEGQSISEHHAPFVATVHVLDGELDFSVSGRRQRMAAHDWLIMPFDAKHDLTALKPTRFMLTLLK